MKVKNGRDLIYGSLKKRLKVLKERKTVNYIILYMLTNTATSVCCAFHSRINADLILVTNMLQKN